MPTRPVLGPRALPDEEAREDLLGLLLTQEECLILLLDPDGTMTWASPSLSRHTGFTQAELRGQQVLACLGGPATDRAQASLLEDHLRRAASIDLDIRLYRKDRVPFWMQLRVHPQRDARGALRRFVLVGRDVTHQAWRELARLRHGADQLARHNEPLARDRPAALAHGGDLDQRVGDVGPEGQRAFFDKIGFLKPLRSQLTELAAPLYPRQWKTINTMTIAFGHGISVTPLHLANGSAAVVNGGMLYSPSLVKRTAASEPGRRIIQAKTSILMRQLLRLNVVEGTGKKADVPGYEVGGKTGTAEKPSRGGYRQKALISSFVGMFPMNDPKFVVLVSLDEPKGIAETGGYATAGMVAAPSVKVIVENIVSLYGILPSDPKEGLPPIAIASMPIPSAPPPPQFAPVSARHRGSQEQRKALPVRPGPNQTAAAPAAGTGRVVAE